MTDYQTNASTVLLNRDNCNSNFTAEKYKPFRKKNATIRQQSVTLTYHVTYRIYITFICIVEHSYRYRMSFNATSTEEAPFSNET